MNWADDAQTGDARADVAVNVTDRDSLLADLEHRFTQGKGFSVATLNLDHVVKLGRDADFRRAYAAHTHVTADGNPVVWLSHLAGHPEVTLVPGSELITPLADLAARVGAPVALFGATEASLTAASDALKAAHPGLKVVLTLAPPMGFAPEGAVADGAIEAIRKSGAQLVFLALGAPKQERFAARAQAQLTGTGFLSIGAGLDFISGAQKRAPALVRALAAEWLWRMAGNPRRLARRYFDCLVVLPGLTTRALVSRRLQKDRAK